MKSKGKEKNRICPIEKSSEDIEKASSGIGEEDEGSKSLLHPSREKGNYTYILRCGDGSFYTGWTNDLFSRIQAHQAGRGGKYTAAHLPVELVYYETFQSKSEAMKREYQIKQLSRGEKQSLILSLSDG